MARKGCSLMVKSVRSAISRHPAAAERFFSYSQILLGAIIAGAAYPLFMTPNHIAPGGITGIATILNHLMGWRVGAVSLILNIPLFLISFRAMGRIFAFRSIIATLLFTTLILKSTGNVGMPGMVTAITVCAVVCIAASETADIRAVQS